MPVLSPPKWIIIICLVIGYDYVSPQAPVTTSALALAHKASVYAGHHGDKVGWGGGSL